MMMKLALQVTLTTLLAVSTQAQIVVRDAARDDSDNSSSRFILPYAFTSETFDTSVGVFGVWTKFPQEQSSLYATAFGSVNGSWRTWLGAYDLRVPGTKRLFLKPDIMGTSYEDVKTFTDGNPAFPDVRAGAHDSDPDDFVNDSGWDGSARMKFRYVLPVGHGREHIINRISADRGMLNSEPVGTTSWNPLDSGRSYLFVEPFYRRQRLDLQDDVRTLRSNGVKLELLHDNTDFILNPSAGSIKSIALTRDWGFFQSSDEWTHAELEVRKFFGLGETGVHRQRVLALTGWLSHVPTWEEQTQDGVARVTRRPPYFEGSTLGGFYRMRAYPVNRFSDKSAAYYSAEFRAIPRWNPLEGISVFGSPEVEWWQWVLFAEAGRVADDLDFGELHSDMNVDAGMGIRLYSGGLVGRLDATVADESWSLVAMIGHTF